MAILLPTPPSGAMFHSSGLAIDVVRCKAHGSEVCMRLSGGFLPYPPGFLPYLEVYNGWLTDL
jgi:hypothetical protein